ncbi:recombinase family protein [Streptomyces sp. NBC_00201]|uniref:recombinase family protein n=1 Tax=unclassified Streptomyces TaxID=2593676 RepID=UPI0022580618|nr:MULTISPECIES: recombinase family protein [unclassified Streptomyces]MCX5055830.1 recombinase family protein [Streptomyces sp. NBC_00452]MCX5247311.1 recombinase family protein [Streptomyces sp. NBC_00201]
MKQQHLDCTDRPLDHLTDPGAPPRPLTRGRGRPPYGFRTTVTEPGTGPDAVAAPGGRQPRLVPDERTAPVVQRIFEEFLKGGSLQSIAEDLNADGIPGPASAWTKSTVRAILTNSRYAGDARVPGGGWQLVAPEVFDQVDEVFARRRKRPRECEGRAARTYALRGLLRCARCNRLMQGTWNNGEPYYRCRATTAEDHPDDHPRNVYLRERSVMGPLTTWVRGLFVPQGLRRLTTSGPHGHTTAAAARHQLRARGVEMGGALTPSAFQALGVRLSYSDADRLVTAKAVLGSAGVVVHGRIEL